MDKKVSSVSESSSSAGIRAMLGVLDDLSSWIDDVPCLPATQGRFGNKAFRTWHEKIVREAFAQIEKVLQTRSSFNPVRGQQFSENEICQEVSSFFCLCFGDPERIDYGSGHEAMFAVVLFCLQNVGVFNEADDAALVFLVFRRYLRVTRKIQTKYNLEPAGSHGVWGLDDYSFLPFLWGSSQLISSQRIRPNFIEDDAIIDENRDEYLYVDAIGFIKDVKKGPFFEHSPMLHDISRIPEGWEKINRGMILMYRGEVWQKRVVIQHFLFGKLFCFEDSGL